MLCAVAVAMESILLPDFGIAYSTIRRLVGRDRRADADRKYVWILRIALVIADEDEPARVDHPNWNQWESENTRTSALFPSMSYSSNAIGTPPMPAPITTTLVIALSS